MEKLIHNIKEYINKQQLKRTERKIFKKLQYEYCENIYKEIIQWLLHCKAEYEEWEQKTKQEIATHINEYKE